MKPHRIILAALTIIALNITSANSFATASYLSQKPNIDNSTATHYKELKERKNSITTQINTIDQEITNASKSKVKKLNKQKDALNEQLIVVERNIATLPQSVTNPHYAAPKSDNSEFKADLDRLAQQKIENTDPFKEQISQDNELEKVYREYLKKNGYTSMVNTKNQEINTNNKLTYRVLFEISSTPLPKSSLTGIKDISTQELSSNQTIYYQGNYATKQEAEKACEKIINCTTFRNAFVIAMNGNQRINL